MARLRPPCRDRGWLRALGGLIVSAVLKYADDDLKGYATAISVILTGILSALFFGTSLDLPHSRRRQCLLLDRTELNERGRKAGEVGAAASAQAAVVPEEEEEGPAREWQRCARERSAHSMRRTPDGCRRRRQSAAPATSDGPSHGAGPQHATARDGRTAAGCWRRRRPRRHQMPRLTAPHA